MALKLPSLEDARSAWRNRSGRGRRAGSSGERRKGGGARGAPTSTIWGSRGCLGPPAGRCGNFLTNYVDPYDEDTFPKYKRKLVSRLAGGRRWGGEGGGVMQCRGGAHERHYLQGA